MMTAVSSIARPVTSMTGQPGCARKMLLRVLELGLHLILEAVVRVDAHAELLEARLADLDERLEADREADDALLRSPLRARAAAARRARCGRFATLRPRCARSVESGVFDVRLTPTRTRSAFLKLRGSLPSSLFTVNSTASMRRKYSSRERQHPARHVDRLAIEIHGELADERADEVERLDAQLVARPRGCTRGARGSRR